MAAKGDTTSQLVFRVFSKILQFILLKLKYKITFFLFFMLFLTGFHFLINSKNFIHSLNSSKTVITEIQNITYIFKGLLLLNIPFSLFLII